VKIDTALSGEEAPALTLQIPYDVILMDQRMYGMDGTEAMHRIREQEDGINHETPIVCLTADAIAGVKEKYLAEGFTDYLSQPIDSLALKRTRLRHLPKDKVVLLKEDEQPAPQSTPQSADTAEEAKAESPFAPLEQAGIHPARGLYYCQQDETLYRSLLAEFATGAKEKEERLQTSYQNKNWKDYALLAHSLKSTAGTIGATTLSENAAVLEAAANSEDIEKIRAEHEKLLELYHCTTEAIRAFCEDEDLSPRDDSGIIEFDPEE
jgi:CheY-like chemotaxis protein